MIYYVLIFLAALGCGVNFVLAKIYQLEQGNTLKTGSVYNCLIGISGAIIYFVICGFKVEITTFSFIMAVASTLFVGAYTIIGFKIMSMGSMAVYTVFLMLGGMILPYFYGVIFLDEKITLMKTIALIIMMIAILMQNNSNKEKRRTLFYVLCIAVFVINGGVSIVSKMHQSTHYEIVSNNGFVLLKNIMAFLVYGAIIPFAGERKKEKIKLKPKMYVLIVIGSLIGGASYMFQLVCASNLPASVQFPVMSGGVIIFTALCGLIFFKENISKKQCVSLVLCLISMIAFVL